MDTIKQARDALAKARRDFERDMRWLRSRYGIAPEPESHQLKPTLVACLDALAEGDPDAMQKAVDSFVTLHRSIMAHVAWHLLEQTKRALKPLRNTDPALFEQKLALWNKASWAYTNAQFRRKLDQYRACVRTVVRI